DVDAIGAEPLERSVASGEHVLAVAADPESLALLVTDIAELGREHDLVAPALDRTADEPLVRERAVDVGGVEEVDPELERSVNCGNRLARIRGSVELGHPHTAEPERGGLETLRAEAALLHEGNLPRAAVPQLRQAATLASLGRDRVAELSDQLADSTGRTHVLLLHRDAAGV